MRLIMALLKSLLPQYSWLADACAVLARSSNSVAQRRLLALMRHQEEFPRLVAISEAGLANQSVFYPQLLRSLVTSDTDKFRERCIDALRNYGQDWRATAEFLTTLSRIEAEIVQTTAGPRSTKLGILEKAGGRAVAECAARLLRQEVARLLGDSRVHCSSDAIDGWYLGRLYDVVASSGIVCTDLGTSMVDAYVSTDTRLHEVAAKIIQYWNCEHDRTSFRAPISPTWSGLFRLGDHAWISAIGGMECILYVRHLVAAVRPGCSRPLSLSRLIPLYAKVSGSDCVMQLEAWLDERDACVSAYCALYQLPTSGRRSEKFVLTGLAIVSGKLHCGYPCHDFIVKEVWDMLAQMEMADWMALARKDEVLLAVLRGRTKVGLQIDILDRIDAHWTMSQAAKQKVLEWMRQGCDVSRKERIDICLVKRIVDHWVWKEEDWPALPDVLSAYCSELMLTEVQDKHEIANRVLLALGAGWAGDVHMHREVAPLLWCCAHPPNSRCVLASDPRPDGYTSYPTMRVPKVWELLERILALWKGAQDDGNMLSKLATVLTHEDWTPRKNECDTMIVTYVFSLLERIGQTHKLVARDMRVEMLAALHILALCPGDSERRLIDSVLSRISPSWRKDAAVEACVTELHRALLMHHPVAHLLDFVRPTWREEQEARGIIQDAVVSVIEKVSTGLMERQAAEQWCSNLDSNWSTMSGLKQLVPRFVTNLDEELMTHLASTVFSHSMTDELRARVRKYNDAVWALALFGSEFAAMPLLESALRIDYAQETVEAFVTVVDRNLAKIPSEVLARTPELLKARSVSGSKVVGSYVEDGADYHVQAPVYATVQISGVFLKRVQEELQRRESPEGLKG